MSTNALTAATFFDHTWIAAENKNAAQYVIDAINQQLTQAFDDKTKLKAIINSGVFEVKIGDSTEWKTFNNTTEVRSKVIEYFTNMGYHPSYTKMSSVSYQDSCPPSFHLYRDNRNVKRGVDTDWR